MAGVVAKIKATLPLLDYLNEYHNLGIGERELPKNISCPLHRDNKPSLRLYSPKTNEGYCFSCGKAYDAITMHQHIRGISYGEAVRDLAKDLNIPLESANFEPKGQKAKELADLVSENMKLVKSADTDMIPLDFDTLARKIYRAVKTGNLSELDLTEQID